MVTRTRARGYFVDEGCCEIGAVLDRRCAFGHGEQSFESGRTLQAIGSSEVEHNRRLHIGSQSRHRPWKAEGVSRSAWYRRRAKSRHERLA
jgi:hypothetical protein